MNYEWPSHYPPDCPPQASENKPKEYYRLISTNPPSPKDFLSTHDEGKREDLESINPCARRSTSLWSTLESAQHLYALYPQLNYKFIVKIAVDDKCGIIKRSKRDKTHYNWWIPQNINIESYITADITVL